MCCSRKFRALIGAFLVAVLTFTPLINVAPIAFAEGDTEAETQDVEAQEANDVESEPHTDDAVTYGGEQLSDWTYTDNGDNSITLTAYNGTATDIIIPGDFGDGKTVKINNFYILKNKGINSLKVVETNGTKVLYTGTIMDTDFMDETQIVSINLSGLNVENVTSLFALFSGCTSLRSINLSGWDTSKVTSMQQVFYNCSSLVELDVSNFNTQNVTIFMSMFGGCESLTTIDVSKFDTSNATNMQAMFYKCKSLTGLDLSHFDTSKVTNMQSMFYQCELIPDLDVTSFNTSNVTKMPGMFAYCSSLTDLDVSDFDTSKVTTIDNMFRGCSGISQLDLSNFDTTNLTTMEGAFAECESLKGVDVSNFNTSNVTNMGYLFAGCNSLEELNLSHFDTSKVTTFINTFLKCSSLKTIDISNFDTSNVESFGAMFSGCSSLIDLDLSHFDTSKAEYFGYMFGKTNLQYLDLSSFTVKDGANLTQMFNVASNDDGTVTELPTAIIATYPKLKALEQDGKLGNGRIPYQSTITFNENEVSRQANDDSANIKTIKADKIFYDSVAEFQEAQKVFTLTKEQVLADIAEPTKAGFTFNGWFTDAAATAPLGDTLTLAGTGDNVTLYAGWTAIEPEPTPSPVPGPGTGDVDNPGSDVSGDAFDSTEQATDEASVSTPTPVTGDNVAIVAGISLSMLILALSIVVFARKRRQQ